MHLKVFSLHCSQNRVETDAVEAEVDLRQMLTIARQQDQDECRPDAKVSVSNVHSFAQGVLHCGLVALVPHYLRHSLSNVSDAALCTLVQQVVDEVL